jgi:hypothetical protein
MVRGLVDGVARALDTELPHGHSLPHSPEKTRGRRFLPALQCGVSAPKIR